MGDVVLQTATVNWLKSIFGKGLELTFVTSAEFASLVENHPNVNRVLSYDRREGDWKSFVGKVRTLHRERRIDLILDAHATLRSLRLRIALWTVPALTVDKRRWERWLLTKVKSPGLRRLFDHKMLGLEPQVERIIRDFENVFGDDRGVRRTADFRHGPHRELTSLAPLTAYPLLAPYIVLAPSASFKFKRWPIDAFVELARELLEATELSLVVLAGPGDDFCRAFEAIESPRLHNLQGKTSLKESMSVLAGAKLCVGNDSGMNHIAEAYGVPCVTIFGPTDPRFGFRPHGEKSTFVSRELWCKPCSTTGAKECYRERHFCMEEITVAEVRELALSALGPA
jgi:ADP-heptose:LPS heptosyltransferase